MHTTPVVIQTMLHIYSCPQSLRDVPAVKESLHRLRKHGLIESVNEGSGYQCTERGLAWINILLETPLPTSAFLDPRNGQTVSTKRSGSLCCLLPTPLTDAEVPVVEFDDEV